MGNEITDAFEDLGDVIVDAAEEVGKGVVIAADEVGKGVVIAADEVGKGVVIAAEEIGKGALIVTGAVGLGSITAAIFAVDSNPEYDVSDCINTKWQDDDSWMMQSLISDEDTMEDEKGADDNTYLLNLSEKPITARIEPHKNELSNEYMQLFCDVEIGLKKGNGIGVYVDVENINDLGVEENELMKHQIQIQDLQMNYTKLINYLRSKNYVTVAPYRSVKIMTGTALNYVTIFIDGILKKDWQTDDREIYSDHNQKIGSSETVQIAPYYNQSLFSEVYEKSVLKAFDKFHELYETAKSDKDNVLKDGTVKEIEKCGLDYVALNFAVLDVLMIASNEFFNDSVKQLYVLGVSVPAKVSVLLDTISKQALDLAQAWEIVASWHIQMSQQIRDLSSQINMDNEDARQRIDRWRETERLELQEYEKEHRKYSKEEQIVFGIFSFGTAVAPMLQYNKGVDRIRRKYRAIIGEIEQESREIYLITARMQRLSNSLNGLESFCKLMGTYFQQQYQNFKNWGSVRQAEAGDIEFLSWSPEKSATWIIDLDRSKYEKYESDIMNEFIKTKKDGSKLCEVNASWLEDVCDVKEADAETMAAQIENLTVKGNVQYKYVKKIWDDNIKWVEEQKKSIGNVYGVLEKKGQSIVFTVKGMEATHREPVLFKQFGNQTVSPQESAAKRNL